MKQYYKDYIIKNIRNGSLHSSSEWIEHFCDYFDLKYHWNGLVMKSTTWNNTIKELVSDGLLEYAYKVKVPSADGRGGGMLTCYKFTSKGYYYRDELMKKE